ncbi:hypothetical protein Q9233_015173 [Columba guinea]|nr:hypothetical protein Q9233_015173 [Columba guinea]
MAELHARLEELEQRLERVEAALRAGPPWALRLPAPELLSRIERGEEPCAPVELDLEGAGVSPEPPKAHVPREATAVPADLSQPIPSPSCPLSTCYREAVNLNSSSSPPPAAGAEVGIPVEVPREEIAAEKAAVPETPSKGLEEEAVKDSGDDDEALVADVPEELQPVESPGEPMKSPKEPMESSAEPVESPGEPMKSPKEPMESSAEPVESPGEPMKSPREPVESSAEPVESPAEPVHGSCVGRPAACQRNSTREKCYSCPVCQKNFLLKINLTIHQRSHSNWPPYICVHCDQSFMSKAKIRCHLREPEWAPEPWQPLPHGPDGDKAPAATEISLWTVVAAVQAVERKVESQALRLLSLEGRAETAEQKVSGLEKAVLEFGSRLERRWAALAALLQDNARRLDTVERQLQHRGCWGPGTGDGHKVPAACEGDAAGLPEQAWGSSDSRHKELYQVEVKGSYEVSLGPGDSGSKPALLPPGDGDGEDPGAGTHGLLETGAVPGQLGDGEIVIKTEEPQPQEEGSELLALPQAPSGRPEEAPPSQEQPVPWDGRAALDEQKAAGEAFGEFCKHTAAQPEFKPVVVPLEAHPVPALPFPTEQVLGVGTDQPFVLPQGTPPGEDAPAERLYRCIECAESFPQKASLEEHQRRHTQQRPFQCSGCSKSFRHRQSLNHHQKVHAVASSPAVSLPSHDQDTSPCKALTQDNP